MSICLHSTHTYCAVLRAAVDCLCNHRTLTELLPLISQCRRQALDFFFTYFYLNYEQSLIPAGTTLDQLAAPAPGPNNAQNQTIWTLQSYALDPAGDTPSLQRLCDSFGCADLSPGQIPVHIGGYQLQVQQPFTAVWFHLLLLAYSCCINRRDICATI